MKNILLALLIVSFTASAQLSIRHRTVTADTMKSKVFNSNGFVGNGYMVDSSGNMYVQNLTVRGKMRVYELLVNQIRAAQSLVISSTGKVERVGYLAPYYYVTTDSGAEHGFAEDDIVRAKRSNVSYGDTYDSWLLVTYVPSTSMFQATLLDGDAPKAGYEYVRMGNQSDTTRQGLIYLTASDGIGPTITIKDGVDSVAAFNDESTTRVVLGSLAGIIDPNFGALHGYGLYVDNVYLRGDFFTRTGQSVDDGITYSYAQLSIQHDAIEAIVAETTATSSKLASLKITADSVRLMALRDSIISYINVSPDSIKISSNKIILDGHAVAQSLEADTLTSVVINGATIWGGDIIGSHFYSYPSNGLNLAGVLVNIEGGTVNFMDRTWDTGLGDWVLTVTQSVTGPDVDNWNSKAAGDHNHDTLYHPLVGTGFTGQLVLGTETLNFENGIFTGVD